MLHDIINNASNEDGSENETNKLVGSIGDAINCIWWHKTKIGYGWYSKYAFWPPELLPEPTEIERDEELLREFAEWWQYDFKARQYEVIDTQVITDFLNQRKNK